jgi:hypothetical protein
MRRSAVEDPCIDTPASAYGRISIEKLSVTGIPAPRRKTDGWNALNRASIGEERKSLQRLINAKAQLEPQGYESCGIE